MGAIAAALGASLSWTGATSWLAWPARTTPVLTVVRISSVAGLCAIALIVLLRGEGASDPAFALYGAAAGVLFAGSIAAFYRGLAVAQMSRVAPVVAAAPMIPAIFGHLQGDRLSAAQSLGIVLIVAGVALAAAERSSATPAPRLATGLGLAFGATVCFGVAIIFIDEASTSDPFWAALAVRIASTVAIVAAALAVRRFVPAPKASLPKLWPSSACSTPQASACSRWRRRRARSGSSPRPPGSCLLLYHRAARVGRLARAAASRPVPGHDGRDRRCLVLVSAA